MLYAVIMAGGKGTRFWPKSTAKKPKQLLPICGKQSMLRQTVNRLLSVVPASRVYVIGNKEYERATRKELPDVPASNIISEPTGRNTAPCLALATYIIKKKDPNAVIIALPADHVIAKKAQFLKLVKVASRLTAKKNVFATIGIKPTQAHTGYGYIQHARSCIRIAGVSFYEVKRFVEKPSLQKAVQYLKNGMYQWNSGMFIFHVSTFVEALKTCLPSMFLQYEKENNYFGTRQQAKALKRIYRRVTSISIDYGIMEKITNVVTVKADIGWNDVGSWSALDDVRTADASGNVLSGKVLAIQSNNNIVDAQHSLIALVGMKDTIVVQTPHAILIAHKDNAQDVKHVVAELEKKRLQKYL